jgi:hypothetical protein
MLYNGEKLIPDPFSISDLSLASGSVITMKVIILDNELKS